MKYSPSFVLVHKRLAPAIPIGRFAAVVNPQAIGFNSKEDFYAPVRFSIQVANGVTGAMRVDVATHKNPNWLQDMKQQLAETMGVNASIELRTVTGMPVERLNVNQLHNAGKLYVYNAKTGDSIRLSELPSVPPEYRVNKVSDLKQWAKSLGSSILPESIAAVLKGKDSHELEAALRSDGVVIKTIETQLQSKQDWPEFVRLHQSTSSKNKIPAEDTKQLLNKVSKQILTYIRNFVGVAADQVKTQIALEQAQKNASHDESHLFKPVLSNVSAPLMKQTRDNKLFQRIAEDALCVPTLQNSLVSAIYNFDVNAKKSTVIASVRPAMKRISSNHHPWYAHIHHTLLPIRGSYPSDYLVRHTRQDMSAKAPFIGDIAKTYEAYHRFSGISSAPPPMKIKAGKLIACGSCGKKPEEKTEEVEEHIGSQMPKLIPISSSITRDGPNLIPISSSLTRDGPTHMEMPKLIPISSSLTPDGPSRVNFPTLIPIDCHNSPRGHRHHRRNSSGSSYSSGSESPGTWANDRIEAEFEDDINGPIVQDEFAHLPSVDDVFK
jgi:hypothetical protein